MTNISESQRKILLGKNPYFPFVKTVFIVGNYALTGGVRGDIIFSAAGKYAARLVTQLLQTGNESVTLVTHF